jgi:release factor glutamine methyltransferase
MIRKSYVTRNVYKPAEDSFLIADQIPYYKSRRTLDLGTGCGVLALVSAEYAQEVIATDINPYASNCTKKNAKSNGLDYKIEVLVGDLFDPIRLNGRFDLIVFNPPYLPELDIPLEDDYLNSALSGGSDGRRVTDRFLEEFPGYLKRNGNVLLVQASLSGIQSTISKLLRKKIQAEIVASKHLQFEEIVVLCCHRR